MTIVLTKIIWLESLFHELQIECGISMLLKNSVSAKAHAHDPIFHTQTKHIEMDHHFISDGVVQG